MRLIVFFLLFLSEPLCSQHIIDSCFAEFLLPKNHRNEKDKELATFRIIKRKYSVCINTSVAIWNGHKIIFDKIESPLGVGHPCQFEKFSEEIGVIKIIYIGIGHIDDVSRNRKFIALKLSDKLKPGEKFLFKLTYKNDYNMEYNKEATWKYSGVDIVYYDDFAPVIFTNSKPELKGSYRVDKMKGAGKKWQTDTLAFEITEEQKKHKWIIITPGAGSGLILADCRGISDSVLNSAMSSQKDSSNTSNSTVDNNYIKNTAYRFKNVFFESGKSELLPESYAELDQLCVLLNKNAHQRIEINGHTDNVGKEEDNQALSENRAKEVAQYLINKGVSPDHISFKGYGSKKPISTNDTENGRQLNRRVEFIIRDK